MSILIKNIKMPKDEPLLVKIDPDGTVSTTARNNYKKYEAVELPTTHGDLVDVGELLYSLDASDFDDSDPVENLNNAIRIIGSARVIIPGEEWSFSDITINSFPEEPGY